MLGIEMLLPAPPARFGRRRPDRLSAKVLDLSVTGAGLLAPPLAAMVPGATVPVELDGCSGRVLVKAVRPADDGMVRYGVQFLGQDLSPAVVELLDVPDEVGNLASSLLGLLDDLADHLDNAAGWGTPDADLTRVAGELTAVVAQFEAGPVDAEDLLSRVCWIDSAEATPSELAAIRHWAQRVNVEISQYPFAARQQLARTLIALATDSASSPIGLQVMRTLAESLLL